MRRGFMNMGIYRNDAGELQGVGLGSDFCAEHEWGIRRMREKLGMKDDIIGIERYMPTKGRLIPFNLKGTNCTWYGLTSHDEFTPWDKKLVDMPALAKNALEFINEEMNIQGAWAEEDFLFIVKDEAVRDAIHYAFIKKNLVICQGGTGNPFSNGSFNLLIRSMYPPQAVEAIKQSHLSQKRLEEAVKKTKIEERLKKAGKRYYALSPRWDDDKETVIRFWLNPMEQQEYDSGWFFLQDLEDWMNNTGKIIKSLTKK